MMSMHDRTDKRDIDRPLDAADLIIESAHRPTLEADEIRVIPRNELLGVRSRILEESELTHPPSPTELNLLKAIAAAELAELEPSGKDIKSIVERESGSLLPDGSLYGTLYRMADQRWLNVTEKLPKGEKTDKRERIYSLTEEGRQTLRMGVECYRALAEFRDSEDFVASERIVYAIDKAGLLYDGAQVVESLLRKRVLH